MYKVVLFFLLFISFNPTFCQEGRVIHEKATLFQLKRDRDTIEFIVVDTVLNEKKPIFLWCQGSLPQPLFGEIDNHSSEQTYYFQGGGIANFNYSKIVESYHLVIVSMPKTPVTVSKEHLNEQFLFVPDLDNPKALLKEYIESDYLNNYVYRGNEVIQYLSSKNWVNTDELVVAGASQGSKVATKIARTNPLVTHLGLFSPNPFGRIDQFVRQPRLDAQLGRITWEEADSLMEKQYDFFKKANNPDSLKVEPRLNAWKTFSEPSYDDWLTLNIPIYLAYGTEDRSADLCDIVPLFFIAENKNNLTLKRYLNLDHNFFEVDKNGRTNHKKAYWNDVIMTFLNWLK